MEWFMTLFILYWSPIEKESSSSYSQSNRKNEGENKEFNLHVGWDDGKRDRYSELTTG